MEIPVAATVFPVSSTTRHAIGPRRRAPTSSEMDDWVVVEVAGSEPEAELLCSVLRGARIECLPRLTNSGPGAGDGLGAVGAHDILVSPQDAQDIRAILQDPR